MDHFKKEAYGKPISKELSMFFALNANAVDCKEASENMRVPLEDVVNLTCCCLPLTPENERVIVELTRLIAFKFNLQFLTLKTRLNDLIEQQIDVLDKLLDRCEDGTSPLL